MCVLINCQKLGHISNDCETPRPSNWKHDYKCYGCGKLRDHPIGSMTTNAMDAGNSKTIQLEARLIMLWMREDGTPTARLFYIKTYRSAGDSTETEYIAEHVQPEASSHQKLTRNWLIRLLMIASEIIIWCWQIETQLSWEWIPTSRKRPRNRCQ